MSSAATAVGIIANPAAGQDIRRLISAASGCSIAEKTNIVRRLCLGMKFAGISRVYLIPDQSGIAGSLLRSKNQGQDFLGESWPEIELLDMPVTEKAVDTTEAVRMMREKGVPLIVVLGGDGTHRLVAGSCGEIPIIGLSTGTNNAFPHFYEATVAGIAAGLVVSGAVSWNLATRRNKTLRVAADGQKKDLALVDLCLTADIWVGSRAIWKPERIQEIFVSFAEPGAIGLSSVAGLIQPLSRNTEQGVHLSLCPPGEGLKTIYAPIAPGLILPLGIAAIETLNPFEVRTVELDRGVVTLDGEREFAFRETDDLKVWLDPNGPLTVDVPRVMQLAAEQGTMEQFYPEIRGR